MVRYEGVPFEVEDNAVLYEESLRMAGFEGICIVEQELPQHIIDWLRVDFPGSDEEFLTTLNLLETHTYRHIQTQQGAFGIVTFEESHVFLDLTGTGLTVTDVDESQREPLDGFQFLVFGDPDLLKNFCLALELKEVFRGEHG